MAKEKEKKVRQKINWNKEMKLAPGYIVIILWVIFTFMLLGWILAASLSTTTDIFAGKALKFPTGLHFENYVQAWGSGGVATFFMNSMLYSLVSCFLLILICAPAAYVCMYIYCTGTIVALSAVTVENNCDHTKNAAVLTVHIVILVLNTPFKRGIVIYRNC